jgi:hypothetical protein
MGERSGRAGKRIGCAAIVTAAGVALGLSLHHGVRLTVSVTTPQWIAEQTVKLRQEECIYRAIRAQVPEGAAVYVTGPDFQPTQRLAELSTPWAAPQANIANARWRLSLVPARGHCSGLALEVHRI